MSKIHRGDDGRIMLLLEDPKHEHDLPDIVTPDATSGPAEWGRYHDAVRDAARTFDNPDHGDIHTFLRARARSPERVDVPAFHEAVKRQRMADLVDILDHHLRRDGSLPRGSRMVRVQAPKGYVRKALRQATPDDLAHLHHRLVSIGHNHEHVSKHLEARAKPDMWDQAQAIQVNFSDTEFDGLKFDDGNNDEFEEDDFFERINDAVKNLPQPIINVYVNTDKEDTP